MVDEAVDWGLDLPGAGLPDYLASGAPVRRTRGLARVDHFLARARACSGRFGGLRLTGGCGARGHAPGRRPIPRSARDRFRQVWLIDTPWVLGEIVAREREGPRARPAADLLVLAQAALAAALRGVPRRLEELRVA